MNTGTSLIIIFLAVGMAALLSVPTIQKILTLRRTPTTWINALPEQGIVEVAGKVSRQNLTSPVNRVRCAYWKFQVEEEQRDSKNAVSWKTVCTKTSSEPIEIADETGAIQVQIEYADLMLSKGVNSDVADEALMESLGISTKNFLGMRKNLRVSETLLTANDQLYVMGAVKTENGIKSLAPQISTPLVISDRSEEGLLQSLYRRVALYMLVGAGAGIVVLVLAARAK